MCVREGPFAVCPSCVNCTKQVNVVANIIDIDDGSYQNGGVLSLKVCLLVKCSIVG